MPPRLSVRCEPFARLFEIVSEASGAALDRSPVDQVRYLQSYLRHEEAGAQTIVVEQPYVDRHWIEEYAGYYATMLEPPPQKATRLHFLAARYTTDELFTLLRAAADAAKICDVRRELNDSYLGYSVIRPLPSAPIGRTVLRPYSGHTERCFAPAEMANDVHVAGLRLVVRGLPFQQQDQGVGACATAAIWSALAKVMRTDGQRPPTPLAITEAATDHRVQTRAFPAIAGLDLEQMATAILSTGYQPHQFRISGEPEIFVLALKAYLRSGVPVIARVRVEDGDLHAITLAGFRDCAELGDKDISIKLGTKAQRTLRSRGVERWYVHDDRLGPYARLGFVTDANGNLDHSRLKLHPLDTGFEDLATPMKFSEALIPLYPKLRLAAEELVELACDMLPRMNYLVGDDNADSLYVEPRFWLGGDYVRELYRRPIDAERIVTIATTMLTSRYVGALSWFHGDAWICDVVYDTTDLRRDMHSPPPILGIIPRHEAWLEPIEKLRAATLGPRPVVG